MAVEMPSRRREESEALRRRRALTPEQAAAVRASFDRMAHDPEYRALVATIAREFSTADQEIAQVAERS